MTRRSWHRDVGCAAALVLSQAALAGAQSESEIAAAARQLREPGAAIEPLPDSPITRDFGEIAVIAHDGSSYDRTREGQPNYLARERVGRRFYETHADQYDFLVVFTNFEFETGGATAFHLYGRNDVAGIGKPVGSVAPVVFGSPARLKGWVDMASVARYRQQPLSLSPGDPGFLRTLGVLAHEMGHQWLAEARYKVGDSIFDDLLGQDEVHWSYLLDSDASFLYGARWRDNADGSFTAAAVGERYSALDLYLMGLLPKEKVPPLRLLRNPDVDRHRINREGELVTATDTTEIAIQQLIDAMGPRRPDSQHSQKEFRLGFVFLAAPGTEPTAEDLEAVERIRTAFGAHFFALTNGVGWADTTLGVATPAAHAATPDVDRALAWLAAQQRLDGSWSDAAETQARDTAAAASALLRAGATGPAWQRGLSWLQQAQPESLDFRARAGSALSEAGLPAGARALLAAALLQAQNADFGFGAGRDFASDALDSALALRALAALDHPADDRVRRAVAGLAGLASPDGGWPAVPGGETSTVVTAEVLLALLDWKDVPGSAALRAPGLAALLARRNPDGGFGSSPSTPHASALALEVLLAAGAGAELTGPLVAWLEREQLADGSWAASPYQTALVVSALRHSGGANLVVADSLVVAPNPAQEGDLVRVTARVRNTGRAAAAASVARFYDADPAAATALGEAPVPALGAGAEAEVSFEYATSGRAGSRTLYVVADAARQVRESREDDNTASRTLTVAGLLADLRLAPEDIAVAPAGPEVGEPTSLSVTVRNAGERAAAASSLVVTVTDPLGTSAQLPPATLPGLAPGEAASVLLAWSPARAGRHTIRATADARYQIPESDETNDTAARDVPVVESAPAGAQLAVRHASVTPASLDELPQPIEIRAIVENTGRTTAATVVAVIDGRTGERLGQVSVELAARASDLVVVRGTLRTAGSRELSVVVDPDDAIPEPDEADNAFAVPLPDAGTLDLELEAASLSRADVELGDSVTVNAVVRNRGTRDVLSVPLQLAHETAGAPAELVRTTLSLVAGEARTVALSWPASFTGDAVPLLLRVDPFDLLVERREDNNAVRLTLRVQPSGRPNLSVSGADVALDPDPLVEGQAATLSAVVRNTGVVPAGAFGVRFVVGDPEGAGTAIGEVAVSGLAAGEARTVSLPWPRVDVRGSLGLYVLADPDERVQESNERDNRGFRPFSAIGLPDLVLTAADVTLDPGYPRAGEAVTIRATVRNLGGRPSAATTLAAAEGEAPTRADLGSVPVPALEPGAFATLAFPWTPGSPPGERPLSLTLDPDGLVTEQDEGNNLVRRGVVVQDADLFLTEPYFSPDGDGVKDQTTLAWRATGRVRVVVSNSRGEPVRTLVEDGPASGSASWDGRDERGLVAWDGLYSVSLSGESGTSLGRVLAVLDTNRSPIQDTVPGRTTVRNLTCALPDYLRGPVWMPGEDELLYVVPDARAGFPVGLLRAAAGGGHSYVAQDDWYRFADFVGDAPVSPDGRDVLMRHTTGSFLVDLLTGERRPFGNLGSSVSWSPDGRFVLADNVVLARDGSVVGGLAYGSVWAWSPASDRLARVVEHGDGDSGAQLGQVEVVARDGTSLSSIGLPRAQEERADVVYADATVWRGDGKIVASVRACVDDGGEAPDCGEPLSFVVDPDAGTATRLSFSASGGAWSPDGSRVLLPSGELRLESGVSLGPLLPAGSSVAPRSSAASFWKGANDATRPGSVCGGKGFDTFVVSSAANLVSQLDVARLPGGSGLVVRGTAADRNLESFQLDFASQAEPAVWHPIGAALDIPVLDDVFGVWVPPGQGTYVLRLRVSDRAGHATARTRVVSWDRVPLLANFTQSDYYLSPAGDSPKKEVVFRYTVLAPARVDVRVVGPEPVGAGGAAAREVLHAAFEHDSVGPRSFTWRGLDDSGEVVPDGRYTVYLNELPFRVEVDGTPPEIGLRFENLHVATATVSVWPDCSLGGLWRRPAARGPFSSVAAERAWHVVDERLKSWVFRTSAAILYGDTQPVFVADADAAGAPVLAGGRPRVRREDGRPADRRDEEYVLGYARQNDLVLEAWDYAGNHSSVNVAPPPEAIFPLGAVWRKQCELLEQALAVEKLDVEGQPLGQPVNGLRAEMVLLQAGTSQHLPPEEQDLHLAFGAVDGGPERELALQDDDGGHRNLVVDSFEALGVDPTRTYRGRFMGRGESGPIASDSFVFNPCQEWLRTSVVHARDEPIPRLLLRSHLDAAVIEARATLELEPIHGSRVQVGTLTLVALDAQTAWRRYGLQLGPGDEAFVAPMPDLPIDCANRLRLKLYVRDAAGNMYPSKDVESACQKLELVLPAECHFAVSLQQDFKGCSGSPDRLYTQATGSADQPVRVTIDGGPAGNPTLLDAFDFVPTADNKGSFSRNYDVSIAGFSGDRYPLRGRMRPLDILFGAGASAALSAIVDRSPPVGEILLPPEGGSLCLAPGSAAPPLETLARIDDAAAYVEARASWRKDGGTFTPLQRLCEDDACRKDPTSVPTGRPFSLSWNASQLDSGGYDLQLDYCDRSGNKGSTTRRVGVTRDPPGLQVVRLLHPVFSPNGDGLAEDAQLTLRLSQAGSLTARVHASSAEGPVVRTLFTDVPEAATDVVVAWDGRRDDGQTVPDGEYAVVFSVADTCGGSSRTSTRVEVDTVPPEAAIGEPSGAERVSASVDVLGRATDLHLASWELDLACGASPEWTRLATRTIQVAPGSFLARWDTASGPTGECRLRLVAEDRAQNRSPEAFATATVERGELIDSLSATPEVFSPNGDGRRETTSLGYTLRRAARVRLEARDSQGRVVRTFESGAERAAGTWSHAWDGLKDTGGAAPDGIHVLWLRAEDPAAPAVYEEKTIRLDLDRTPPQVVVTRPAPDGVVAPSMSVRGTVTDRNLALFVVSATPAGGAPVELVQGPQSATDADLAPLAALAEGPHVLRVVARDAAENETPLDVPFLVDATPPRVAIQLPAAGAILRRGETPIEISGLVADLHLDSWTLRFGAGTEPLDFVAIGHGQTGGNGIPLAAWDVRFVPDGAYTLSLLASDRAGLASESRITLTLDSRAPLVALAGPSDGGYVTAAGPVTGTASDDHLGTWELEWAPGLAATAYQWSPLGSGSASVTDTALAEWAPLPPDGVYTLRLSARDKVGLSSSTRATVTVDTTPPAPPTGLAAHVTRAREGYGRVVVGWSPNREPDLAGYRIERGHVTLHDGVVSSPAWDDGERLEGRYSYSVVAVDKAGNESAPATLAALVDLTPPLVSFSFPAPDAAVAGAIDVRGTAYSADDFAEYRLLVGAGEAPAAWTQLRRSSVPVAAGSLGDWLALADGPYLLAVEAEDTNGNRARVTRRVVVDTLPPEPPVLTSVARPPAHADWLVPSWQSSPSGDVAGTLVYRNGRLANAGAGIALGDRSGFLVPGASYEDRALPDGEHCYRVVAMDRAGNESVPSNEICQPLDNRAPRALVTQPPDGTRFGFPVHVVAETPDLDVVSVRFERRAPGADWVAFGETRGAPPWETTLDPRPAGAAELAAGPHELRAVATDRTGNTDPAPALVTVIYGDTTAPSAPTGLVAAVRGRDVALTWNPVAAPDLASYRVYRDGERVAAGLSQASYTDPGLAPDGYRYSVTAVDRDGNESEPSQPADAVVYLLRLDVPAWPVVPGPAAAVTGDGSRPGTTVKLLREGERIAQAPATGGAFRVEGVALVADGNLLRAEAEDAAFNRSVPSNEIVLISNAPPAAVTGLEADVTGSAVALRWGPVADADLVGYLVRRDGERLTTTSPQTQAAEIAASSRQWQAESAFDGNPATAWTPGSPGTGSWSVSFPAPVLVERLRLRFGTEEATNPGTPTNYTILARWQDRELPIVRVRGNTRASVDHVLPSPFLTSALRVVLETPGGLAEIGIDRTDAVRAGSEAFLDRGVPDGRHAYAVTAIDRYGAEGAPGSVEAAVGDVDPPGPPSGLVATVGGRDVQLTWGVNPEPDVTGYVVLRDGARIGTSASPAYFDRGRPNGSYRYAVVAVDAASHQSDPSAPADATIDVQPVPPAAPQILQPTDAAHPLSLSVSRTDVAGRAADGASVALDVDGEPRGTAPAGPALRAAARLRLEAADGVALSPDGRFAAWATGADAVTLRDLASGTLLRLAHGGSNGAERLAFSPDGKALALTRLASGFGATDELVVLRLDDASVRILGSGRPADCTWSPDGSTLAVSLYAAGEGSLQLVDVASGAPVERARGLGRDTHLRWSPDGARIAFVRSWWDVVTELRVLDLGGSRERLLDPDAWPLAAPSWSPDGHHLAWTSAETRPLRVRVQDLDRAEPPTDIAEAGSDLVDARFSADGDWLSFVRLTHPGDGATTLRSVHAIHQRRGLRIVVREAEPAAALPDGHDWIGGRLAIRELDRLDLYAPETGWFVIRAVPLAPGENRLVARASDPVTGLGSGDSETVLVRVPEAAFPDLSVVTEGILSLPPVPVAGTPAQLRVRVLNTGNADAGETDVRVRVVAPGGAIALETLAALAGVTSGGESSLLLPWTPASPGSYQILVELDPDGRVEEAAETNNTAERALFVAAEAGLVAGIGSDRTSYPSLSMARVTVQVANSGLPFEGVARTTVEELDGRELALLDERAVSLEWGRSLSFTADWAIATTRAGRYAFRVRVRANGETAVAAVAERVFDIEPGVSVLARVRPQPVAVAEGAPARFALSVDNRSTNAALEGAFARLRVQLEGASGPATFETVRALPALLPGATWEALDSWPSAGPAGRYAVRFDVEKDGAVLASASAVLTIVPVAPAVAGTLAVSPGDVLAGEAVEARVTLENRGGAGVAGYPVIVEVVAGAQATVHASVESSLDLAAGEARPLTLAIATATIAPGSYVVRLRGGASPVTLDSASLVVHGLVAPPSPHAPVGGSRVTTNHPLLVVNNAAAPAGVALRYEFELFGDEALTQALPGARGVAETPSRTAWPVAAGLAEDTSYWWHARASDGFSTSAWSTVASFAVDAVNLPPTAPVPDTPAPDARVASRQPALTVRNAVDPERQPLAYEFRLAVDEAMSGIVAAQAGIAEGLGLTAWTPSPTLDEDALYYWSARARTSGDAPEDFSPWSVPVAFQVDTFNGSPSAPRPLRPTGGADVSLPTPALVVANASDPEGDALTYRFEIDTRPTLDSPGLQVSAELPPGVGETAWTAPLPLAENTRYYWRAHASDGHTATPSVLASFFVDGVNEAPAAPVPLDPVDGRVVPTATPTLRLRNAVDPEADVLVYEFEVRAADGTIVAEASGIPAGVDETTWTVEPALPEDQAFTWSARASDGELFGLWSAPARFRVDAVVEPPTAPVPRLPAEGSVVDERRRALVVKNATSPDRLPLSYTFELEAAAADGSVTLVDRAEGVAEGTDTTAHTPPVDLADGSYQWRARASDSHQSGPWSSTAHFSVLVDPPPAAPTGLRAMAGDASVRLDWNASPEPDVTGYRVYRAATSGGPYTRVATVTAPSDLDTGLTNGVTYYYVVTARDAQAESLPSKEAAARPEAPQALVAEVRYDPSVIPGECLLSRDEDDDADHHDDGGSCARRCPEWLLATIELPAGHDPRTIEMASLRLFGSVSADPRYREIVDTDRDHIPELRVRFRFDALASHLSVGANTATIVGRAAGSELRGSARIDVLPVEAELWVTPRTLQRRSAGQSVQARITFGEGVDAKQVALGSVRLNGVVPLERLVEARGQVLVVKFDRARVAGVLPLGAAVEVRVTGTLAGLPFAAVDHIRVIE